MGTRVVEQLEWQFIGNDAPLNSAFQRAENLSKQHVSKVNKQLSGLGSTINVYNYFLADMKKTEREAEQHVGRMNSILGKLKGGFSSIMGGAMSVFGGNLLFSGFEKAADAAKELMSLGYEFTETWEQASIRILAFNQNAKETDQILNGIYDIAVDRGLKFAPFADYAVRLASANYSANETIHTLKGVAAAAEALGKGSEDMSAFVGMITQMEDSGKAAGRALLQLEKQGFQVFATLEKMTGVDRKVIAKRFQMGQVDPRGAIAVLTEGWSRQFKDYRDTLQEEQERTSLMLARQSSKAFGPVLELQKHTMQRLQDIIKQAGPGFADGLGAAMGYAAGALTKGLDYLIELAGIKLETHSPSRVFFRFGVMAMQGLGDGFLAGGAADEKLRKTFEKILANAELQDLVKKAAAKWNISEELINAVMAKESGGNPRATSPKGAKGLMQFMPGTAAQYGLTNPYDPAQAIDAGAHHLSDLIKEFGDLKLVLAAYNAGSEAVKKYGGNVPPYTETQDYVAKIVGLITQNPDNRQPSRWGGIYAGIPQENQSMFSMSEDQQNKLNEYDRIIKESTDQIRDLNAQIKKLYDVANRPGMQDSRESLLAGAQAPQLEGRRDFIESKLKEWKAEREKFVQLVIDANHNQQVINSYFSMLLRGAPSLEEQVKSLLDKMKSGEVSTTGLTDKELAANKPTIRRYQPMLGATDVAEQAQGTAKALELLKDSTIATAEEQKKFRDELFGHTTIFGDARKILSERQGGLDIDIRDSKVQAITDMPKNLAAVAGDFLTKWDGTWKGANQILLGGLRSVVVEPLARVFQQQIEKWIAQMLINLLGEKIFGSAQITAQTANTTAISINAAAVTANTAAVTALAAAMSAQAGGDLANSLISALGAGAGAAAGGGFVKGPGGPTSDDVPMWLSNGEYVIKESVVRKRGKRFFDMINSDSPTHMRAGGGPVSDSSLYAPPARFYGGGGAVPTHITKQYNVQLTAPILGGSSHEAPRSRREYLEMLRGPLQEALEHAS